MHIPRKIIRCYPLSLADTHAIPSLLTGYPQVVKFSGDESLCSRSEDSFLSRDEPQKDGSILIRKIVCASGLLSMSYLVKSESVVYRLIWRRRVVGVLSVSRGGSRHHPEFLNPTMRKPLTRGSFIRTRLRSYPVIHISR